MDTVTAPPPTVAVTVPAAVVDAMPEMGRDSPGDAVPAAVPAWMPDSPKLMAAARLPDWVLSATPESEADRLGAIDPGEAVADAPVSDTVTPPPPPPELLSRSSNMG